MDVVIKQEPQDLEIEDSCQQNSNDEVVYMGTEIFIKYLQGDLSLDQFNAMMEDGIKDDEDSDAAIDNEDLTVSKDSSVSNASESPKSLKQREPGSPKKPSSVRLSL